MAQTNNIILFEDNLDNQAEIHKGLSELRKEINLILVDKEKASILIPPDIDDASEDVLVSNLSTLCKTDEIGLIVVDHDLSQLKSSLSESIVTAAAHELAIPVCRYHRRSSAAPKQASNWELNSNIFAIDVDFNGALPRTLLDALDGFKELQTRYENLDPKIRSNGPAVVLATILDKPGLATHFSLYTSGISFLNDPLIVSQHQDDKTARKEMLAKRIPYVLGYWLYNSILKFPGIILNEEAAASYLDIATNDFLLPDVAAFFQDARYRGPFSNSGTYWWRAILDDMLDDEDAHEYLKNHECPATVNRSKCSRSGATPAGYYDLFTKKPISKDASVGSLSWIPQGADLARVDKERYEELAPILNL